MSSVTKLPQQHSPLAIIKPKQPWHQRQSCGQVSLGLFVLLGVAISWACATQFSQSALKIRPEHFYAPYFMVWFSTTWMTACYPVYLLYASLKGKFEGKPKTVQLIHREAAAIFGASGFRPTTVLQRVVPFVMLWIGANYAYSQALGHITVSETTAIMSSNPAFVCLLGWFLLKDRFNWLRLIAVGFAIAGIVLMGYENKSNGLNMLGVVLAVAAAGIAATYKVLFKRVIGDANLGQVSLFMTSLGCIDLTVNCIPAAILVFTGLERVHWAHVPWLILAASAVLNLIFNFLINFGIALTHPLFISVGMLIGYPLGTAIDVIFRDVVLTKFLIIGGSLIIVSFCIVLLPSDWSSRNDDDNDKNNETNGRRHSTEISSIT